MEICPPSRPLLRVKLVALLSRPWRVLPVLYGAADVEFSSSFPQTDEVFLEAQIQNITTSPMFMEKVSLEPSMMYNVTELNTVTSRDAE